MSIERTHSMVNIVSRYAIGLEGANRFDSFFESPYSKDFQKFWGFDARQGYDPELFDVARFEEYCGRPPKNAEVGCTLSHLNVYKKFLEEASNDDDILIVAEDDAIIDADVDALVQKIFTMYPSLGVINLADGFAWEAHKRNPYAKQPQISLLSPRIDSLHKVGPYGGRLTCTGLYAMTRKAVQVIINLAEENGAPYWVADEWGIFTDGGKNKIYAMRPGICGWVGDSIIQSDGNAYSQVIYNMNVDGRHSFVDKLRISLAPRARWSNFKTSLEATRKHIDEMIGR